MQVKVVKNVPLKESSYLRVALLPNRKSTQRYFYIGSDIHAMRFLSEAFTEGYCAKNFESAKKTIKNGGIDHQPDAFFIDVDYNPKALADFQFFLKLRGLYEHAPFIYNERHLEAVPASSLHSAIDDIVDLKNWNLDLSTKVSFLKKAKENSTPTAEETHSIKVSTNIYKRAFDIVVASLLILLLLPLLLVIAITIKLESKGPVFYIAKRAGRGFKVFSFFKFRTMEVNADKKIDMLAHLNQYNGSTGAKFFKINNDPRITRVGRFLRNTSLDELPQLFNVLKGDMSLVGNRPLPIYEAATLTTNEFVERFMAPAGMTGLWQIKKRGQSDMSAEERISLDISYVRNSNLLYDLWIMIMTPKALIQRSDV